MKDVMPQSGWDSREHFAREIVRLITIYNSIMVDRSGNNLRSKMESVIDLFDTTAAWFKEEKITELNKNIDEVEKFLYKHFNNPTEDMTNKMIVNQKIREVYRDVMFNIKKAGLLMPEKSEDDWLEPQVEWE
jgi:3-oxoacyl-ACP reductase-like protein